MALHLQLGAIRILALKCIPLYVTLQYEPPHGQVWGECGARLAHLAHHQHSLAHLHIHLFHHKAWLQSIPL